MEPIPTEWHVHVGPPNLSNTLIWRPPVRRTLRPLSLEAQPMTDGRELLPSSSSAVSESGTGVTRYVHASSDGGYN